MKKSRKIAFTGMMSALSIVIIFVGTILPIFAYVSPIISGLTIIFITNSISKKYSTLSYITVSIISMLFMPDKECILTYIFFFGYYPIIKPFLDKQNKILSIFLKILIFNIGICSSQIICFYIFGIPFDDFLGEWGIIILLIFANSILYLYDKLLIFSEILCEKKLNKKIKHLFM